jgi:hypothetical protein
VSKAQVGSSASIIFGDITNALAIATLCFCHPESSFGILLTFHESHTFSKASFDICVADFQEYH